MHAAANKNAMEIPWNILSLRNTVIPNEVEESRGEILSSDREILRRRFAPLRMTAFSVRSFGLAHSFVIRL
jgi:hypothetical protein